MRKHDAKEGYIWKSKRTGDILSEILILGKEDSIENYEEVVKEQLEINNLENIGE